MNKKNIIAIILLIFALFILIFISLFLGNIKVTYLELFKGLFIEYNEKVASIYNIRFPRIFLCILGGASLSVSGVLFQVILKNPIADASILGISSGSSLATATLLIMFPNLYFFKPIVAFLGGIITFCLIIFISRETKMSNVKFILIGIAINSVFTGIIDTYSSMNSSITSAINANVSFKTWDDVNLMFYYSLIALIIAQAGFKFCDILSLDDKTAINLGFNTTIIKIFLLFVAVILASISTSVLGVIYFLGLIVPHIARSIVGSKHSILLPFSMCLGSFFLLLADTIGRTIIAPYEISAGVIMNVFGGFVFIFILRKSGKTYEN